MTYIFKDSYIFSTDWLQRYSAQVVVCPSLQGKRSWTTLTKILTPNLLPCPDFPSDHPCCRYVNSLLSLFCGQANRSIQDDVQVHKQSSEIFVLPQWLLCLCHWISYANLGYFCFIMYQSYLKCSFTSKHFLMSLLHNMWHIPLETHCRNTTTESCNTALSSFKVYSAEKD